MATLVCKNCNNEVKRTNWNQIWCSDCKPKMYRKQNKERLKKFRKEHPDYFKNYQKRNRINNEPEECGAFIINNL